MSKKKPMDKAQARARRDALLAAAAAARLSPTEGVREMRAIANMTQEEFARHRGVSARVIKALELGQGNPTVATLNRIGQFFGLEVAFVPVRRAPSSEEAAQPADAAAADIQRRFAELEATLMAGMQDLSAKLDAAHRPAADGEARTGTSGAAHGRPARARARRK